MCGKSEFWSLTMLGLLEEHVPEELGRVKELRAERAEGARLKERQEH